MPLDVCGSDACTNASTFVVHWPGRRINMCESCKDRAKKIADTLGFALSIDPVLSAPVVVREGIFIVCTCRDDTKRIFPWDVGGNGPDNTWSILSAIVDHNLSIEPEIQRHFDIVRIQAARLEPAADAARDRR